MKLASDPDSANQLVKVFSEIKPIGYIWFILLAIWGGTSSYISRIRKNKIPFSTAELIGEWVISGFAGLLTAYFGLAFNWDFYLIAVASGVSGHMGGRAIGMFENWMANKIPGAKVPESDQ